MHQWYRPFCWWALMLQSWLHFPALKQRRKIDLPLFLTHYSLLRSRRIKRIILFVESTHRECARNSFLCLDFAYWCQKCCPGISLFLKFMGICEKRRQNLELVARWSCFCNVREGWEFRERAPAWLTLGCWIQLTSPGRYGNHDFHQ